MTFYFIFNTLVFPVELQSVQQERSIKVKSVGLNETGVLLSKEMFWEWEEKHKKETLALKAQVSIFKWFRI